MHSRFCYDVLSQCKLNLQLFSLGINETGVKIVDNLS